MSRVIPSSAEISLELDRLTLHGTQKKLSSTFISSFSVRQRLGDLSVDRLPDPEPALDKACTKTLTSGELEAVTLAYDALMLFTRLAYLVDHDNPGLRGMVLQLWGADIWKSMIFLYNSGVDLNETLGHGGKPIPLTRMEITAVLVQTLLGCVKSSTLLKKLVAVPDIVGLIGRLWTENLELADNTVHDELIFIIQCILEKKTESVLSVLIDAVGGAKAFMEAALERFRFLSSAGPIVVEDLAPQLMFIDFLTENFTVLHDVMHQVDVLSATIPAVIPLIRRAEGSIVVGGCIHMILLPHLQSADSVQPLIHAINKGLLRALYDARIAFLYAEDAAALVKAVQFILTHVIAPSLIFRSVLHAVERSEIQTGFFDDHAEYRSRTDVPALPEWDTFYDYYLVTFASRESMDVVFRGECGLRTCRKRDDNGDFKRCGKCQNQTYCSKACQQLNWREHKHYCVEQDEIFSEGPLLCPVSDREFVRKMAIFEVHQNMKTLWQRIQSHPVLAAPNADLMFQVDFTTVEKDITVAPIDESMDPSRARGKAMVFGKVKAGREVYMVLAQMTGMFMLKRSL